MRGAFDILRQRRLVHVPASRRAWLAVVVVAAVTMLSPTPRLTARQSATGKERSQPGAAFRVEIDLVNVDVAVTDERGVFLRDLRADEFEVFEDGKRQDVSTFTLVNIPIETRFSADSSAAGPPEPDVRSNDVQTSGRVYIVVLDDLHVQVARSASAKEVARRFIQRHLGPHDLAAVVHTSGRADASQDFTTSSRLLLRAVDKFVGQGMRSSMLDRLEEYQGRETRESDRADQRLNQVADPYALMRADFARRMLKALSNVGDLLSATQGRRKAIVLVSEGVSYDLMPSAVQTSSGLTTFASGSGPDILTDVQQAIRAVARANISIYSIDPRGLAGPGDDLIEVSSLPSNPLLGLTPDAFQREIQRAQDSLRVLSDQTGGAASVSSNDFGPALQRIVSDNSTYYMLGYHSSNDRKDGRFRSIDVRVKRPGVRVRARKGYVATAPAKSGAGILTAAVEPSAVLRGALNSPLPVTDIPLRAFAAPFKGEKAASVAVGIEIDASKFRFEEAGGFYTDKVEVAIVALDDQAKFKAGDRYTVALRLKPDTYQAVRAQGVRVLFRLDLPAGHFQLRAAAHESGAGATGSVAYDLDVPDFSQPTVSLSGVVLTTTRAALMPTARPDPILGKAVPTPPTGLRTFSAGDTMTVIFEVYGGATSVDVIASVRADDGGVRVRSQDEASDEEMRRGGGGVGFAMPLVLADLKPGPYTLRVEVRPRTNPGAVVRELPFQIVSANESRR